MRTQAFFGKEMVENYLKYHYNYPPYGSYFFAWKIIHFKMRT